MAVTVTYNQIERQVSIELGNILGGDVSTADTNYSAAPTTTNRKEPDFPPAAIQDAILATIGELVQSVAETPLHPWRVTIRAVTSALVSGDLLPVTIGGVPVIGRWGRVTDSSSGLLLQPVDVDAIRSFNRFAASVYSGKNSYWYAIENANIEHTRAAVIVEGCVWNRPAWAGASLIPFSDTCEWPIVWGAVCRLAPREWKEAGLTTFAQSQWDSWITRIRGFADPVVLTGAASAPAVV